jgi:BarA-like signal transduction histidine kinase
MLPKEEAQVITRKYQAIPFLKMSAIDLANTANLILIKIHVITGWNFPQEPEFQKILKDQFSKKLLESYPLVNAIEMEFAFRNNTAVKDWGKNMNLNLIDEIMLPYLHTRAEASKLEQQAHFKCLPSPVPEIISDEEIIQISRDIYAKTKNWKYIAIKTYHLLQLQLSDDEKNLIRIEVKKVIDEMYMEDVHLFKAVSRNKLELRFCKKLAVARYFEKIEAF